MKIRIEFIVPNDFHEDWYEVLSEFATLEIYLPSEEIPQAGDFINLDKIHFANAPSFWISPRTPDDQENYQLAREMFSSNDTKVIRRVFSRKTVTLFIQMDGARFIT